MGFGAYARSAGIERLISREDYEAAHGTGDFDGYWGIWDEPFLQYAGEVLDSVPEPFFATLFTLSAHHPFVVPDAYAATLPAGYTKIHRGVAYDDEAFRRFFARYGGEAWFRRTIFVFVADHVSSEKFAPETRTYPGNMHILGFLYTPDGALQGEIGEVTQQLDIMPTLLGLLGCDEAYFAFGRDVLNEPARPRWSVSYDGGFRALTGDTVLTFDDNGSQITPRTDRAAMPPAVSGAVPAAKASGGTMVAPEHAGEPSTAPTSGAPAEKRPSAPGASPVVRSAEELLGDFQALVQQYYMHIEKKNYTTHDD